MAVGTVGWFVRVRAEWIAEVETGWVCPEGGVDNFDVLLADGFGVIAVVFVITFL